MGRNREREGEEKGEGEGGEEGLLGDGHVSLRDGLSGVVVHARDLPLETTPHLLTSMKL